MLSWNIFSSCVPDRLYVASKLESLITKADAMLSEEAEFDNLKYSMILNTREDILKNIFQSVGSRTTLTFIVLTFSKKYQTKCHLLCYTEESHAGLNDWHMVIGHQKQTHHSDFFLNWVIAKESQRGAIRADNVPVNMVFGIWNQAKLEPVNCDFKRHDQICSLAPTVY